MIRMICTSETDDSKQRERPAAATATEPVLGVTPFDRVFSLLVTCILLLGLVTVGLGAVWLTNQQWVVAAAPARVDMVEVPIPGDLGGTNPFDEMPTDPVAGPDSSDPSAVDNDSAPATDATEPMNRVIDAIGNVATNPDELAMLTDAGATAVVPGGSTIGTSGRRLVGDGPGRIAGVSRSKRWEISFESGQTEQEYARQLDYFHVELGAIVDQKIYYASSLSSAKPSVRTASSGADEKRLFFSWRTGGRRQIDLSLLKKAGIPVGGEPIVLHFYPADVEQRLARMELDYLDKARGTANLRGVRKTRFVVVRDKNSVPYDFEITRQEYFGQPESEVSR
jgi:hypothetical protein